MESQLRNTRDWIRRIEIESKDLEPVLEKAAVSSRTDKWSFEDQLRQEQAIIVNMLNTVRSLVKDQSRLMVQLKRTQHQDPRQKIRGKNVTYKEEFIASDERIIDSMNSVASAREELLKYFKKNNLRLIFVHEQILSWQPEILSLQQRRRDLQPGLDGYFKEIAVVIADSPDRRTLESVSEQAERIEILLEELDRIDRFFEGLERLVIHEIGGVVYFSGIGDPPQKFEQRFVELTLKYDSILDTLNQLL